MPKAKVNGIELAYEEYGAGEPLVLAHGYTASKEMWDSQIGPFSEKYRVVVYDMRGHGGSDSPPSDDPGYALETLVEDQRALMEHLGIEQAYVGGLSMGGMIAMRFALKHPEAIRALLLFDTSAGMAAGESPLRRQWAQNREAVEAMVRKEGVAAVQRRMYGQREADAAMPRPTQIPDGVRRHVESLAQMRPDGFLGAGRALRDQSSVLDRLPEIAAPTMILVGENDWLRGPSESMKERMPDARFVLIKGSIHGTCLWQPEKFTSAVLDFLGEVEAGRPVAGSEER